MRYHPDRSDDPRSSAAFVLVNEAYEYLKDPERRAAASKPEQSKGRQRDEDIRRENHDDWEGYQKEAARQRAYRHAQQSAQEFSQSPFYKAAEVVDRVYNYVFLAIGVLIILMPIYWIDELRDANTGEVNQFGIVVPFIIGVCFLYGIWYFLFKLKE